MKKITYCTLSFLVLCIAQLTLAQSSIWVEGLTCVYKNTPLGIDEMQPSLSWQLKSNERSKHQSAYQVLVASEQDLLDDENADVWNTGKLMSDNSTNIIYKGKRLESRQRYFWKVRVWDEDDEVSTFSAPSYWEMGLLESKDWQAEWIRHPEFTGESLEPRPAPYFRKDFQLNKPVKSARAYVTGLGYFEFHLNGKKVGDHVLDPVKTKYDKTVKYVTFDITDQLQAAENTAGMILGTGWYNHFAEAAWGFDEAPWRSQPEMICQIEVVYEDGTTERIVSDDTWTSSQGAITFDGIRNGEHYDARMELPGWDAPYYDDEAWQNAAIVEGPAGRMSAQHLPPIKEMKQIKPVSITEVKPGVYVFDLGQNIAGYSRLKVAGPKGTEITMKHGERLYPDGTVEQKQILRFLKTGEAQTDKYTLKGEGVEEWHPRFVYHGYQYVEVSGLPVKPTKATITGVVIHTAFDSNGSFECSNPLFNRIQELTRWSYIGNYHGIPTDCPHREKIGWSGDGHLVTEAGLYNYDVTTSYIKWLDDFVDEQRPDGNLPGVIPTSGWGYEHGRDPQTRHLGYGPSWEGALILIPWYLYQHTGDTSILIRYYEPITKYLEHLRRNSDDHLLNFGIDDHKAFYTKTDGPIIASGYYYYLTQLFVKMSEILGENDNATDYKKLAGKIKDAFVEQYFHKDSKKVGNGGQTSLSEALYMDLLPEASDEVVMKHLLQRIDSADHHFDAGVVGVKFLFEALSKAGYDDVIYKMVNQRDFPSYGYWIAQGANTLWQDWDGSMSLNHIMFGSVSEWFFESLAGINPDPDQPGFKCVIISPEFIKDLDWVQADHDSQQGTITSGWERSGNLVTLRVNIPVNSTATVVTPAQYELKSGGYDVENGDLNIGSGKYEFTYEYVGD